MSPEPTRTVAGPPAQHSSPNSSPEDSRFLPGEVLAERYRITSLLGAGGMGEVYRATDLKLGQQVALKFLPPGAPAAALMRFRGEVRMARSISHPNVCRVYDIAEVNGQTFLSMEYVDGEDLASLLRRIGRLPHDKATDIARQICAGLAAAHSGGVLHRDLKPGNVLIDGRGLARIADFGLAAAEEIRAGTPAYMAPEQLAGREVTIRSDIYALGLVLYELFTGKRALQSPGSTPEPPSSALNDIEPAVERAIERCLEVNPADRPSSALAVAAMLPGGDPLAAALAAGETPSPAMVANAGTQSGVRTSLAVAMLAVVMAGLPAIWILRSQGGMLDRAGLELPPSVLQHRGRELMSAMGYSEKPVDTASGFYAFSSYLEHRRTNRHVQFPAALFWYREHPESLVNSHPVDSGVTVGAVSRSSPPITRPGMSILTLDPSGRLLDATVRPPEKPVPSTEAVAWPEFLRRAGFDPTALAVARPEWQPAVAYASRVAWTGNMPETDTPVRIEAAELAGRVVAFRVIPQWVHPNNGQPAAAVASLNWRTIVTQGLVIAAALGALILARVHVRSGKGDRRGAFRVSMFMLVLHLSGVLFGADHTLSIFELELLTIAVATGLMKAALVWLGYLAVEPLVRRRFPHALVSWSRLTGGRWRDPLVGRDILIGLCAGIGAHVLWSSCALIRQKMGADYSLTNNSVEAIGGFRYALALIPNETAEALLQAFTIFVLFFLCRLVLRRDTAALLLASLLLAAQNVFGATAPGLVLVMHTAAALLLLTVTLRVGLLGIFAALWLVDLMFAAPVTWNPDLWFAPYAMIFFGLFAAAALLAFRVALAGRRILPEVI